MKGLSITLCFGSYGGFHAYARRMMWRLCLGWVALTIYFVDLEDYIEHLRSKQHRDQQQDTRLQ